MKLGWVRLATEVEVNQRAGQRAVASPIILETHEPDWVLLLPEVENFIEAGKRLRGLVGFDMPLDKLKPQPYNFCTCFF